MQKYMILIVVLIALNAINAAPEYDIQVEDANFDNAKETYQYKRAENRKQQNLETDNNELVNGFFDEQEVISVNKKPFEESINSTNGKQIQQKAVRLHNPGNLLNLLMSDRGLGQYFGFYEQFIVQGCNKPHIYNLNFMRIDLPANKTKYFRTRNIKCDKKDHEIYKIHKNYLATSEDFGFQNYLQPLNDLHTAVYNFNNKNQTLADKITFEVAYLTRHPLARQILKNSLKENVYQMDKSPFKDSLVKWIEQVGEIRV